jgi:predicted NAD-dependent protein-ADP-ribosyltransferase YbiA (DUF1768 family)
MKGFLSDHIFFSLEQAYQHDKCRNNSMYYNLKNYKIASDRWEKARQQILNIPWQSSNPSLTCKIIANQAQKEFKGDPQWEVWIAKSHMDSLLTNKARASRKFRDTLLDTGTRPLIHNVRCLTWGSGSDKQELCTTGKNLHGTMLEECRTLLSQNKIKAQPLTEQELTQDRPKTHYKYKNMTGSFDTIIPQISCNTLIIGASNIGKIPTTSLPYQTQLIMMNGARIRHLSELMILYKKSPNMILDHPTNIILTIGLNHKDDSLYVLKQHIWGQFLDLMEQTRLAFPKSTIIMTEQTCLLPRCHESINFINRSLQDSINFNNQISPKYQIQLVKASQAVQISRDGYHWTEPGAQTWFWTVLMQSQLAHQNVLKSIHPFQPPKKAKHTTKPTSNPTS